MKRPIAKTGGSKILVLREVLREAMEAARAKALLQK